MKVDDEAKPPLYSPPSASKSFSLLYIYQLCSNFSTILYKAFPILNSNPSPHQSYPLSSPFTLSDSIQLPALTRRWKILPSRDASSSYVPSSTTTPPRFRTTILSAFIAVSGWWDTDTMVRPSLSRRLTSVWIMDCDVSLSNADVAWLFKTK